MLIRRIGFVVAALTAIGSSAWAQCEQGKFLASNASAGAAFGTSLSVRENVALVGAPDANGEGAAYVFLRSGAGWTQRQALSPFDGQAGDRFGASVAIFGNTGFVNTAFIGAPGDDDQGDSAGAVYVFERENIAWVQVAKLYAPVAQAGAEFGTSVALWFDFAMAGAPFEDGAMPKSGAVHFFLRSLGSWIAFQTLLDSNGESGDEFGISLALEGGSAAIGARGDDELGADAGSVHLFEQGAISFFPVAQLFAADAGEFQQFGRSVALDGNTVLVGAPFASGAGGPTSGAAYVFDPGSLGWYQTAKLTAADSLPFDDLGGTVAISGGRALVGATQNLSALAGNGRAYLFQRAGAGWVQTASLAASDGQLFDDFGSAVAMHSDHLMVGCAFDDDVGQQSGSVYFFASQGAPSVYCTAKVTSSGCLPSVSASGAPSASAGSGFVIRAGAVEPGNIGILFYGTNGPASTPLQGGFLCVNPPILRTAGQVAGGNGPCGGTYAFDFNAHVASGVDPQLVPGVGVNAQYWFRDPPATISGTGLSDAIAFELCQ